MKKFIKFLSLTLTLILTFSFIGCNKNAPTEDETSNLSVQLTSGETVIDSENNTVSKRLTAFVYPVDAPNKLVDWSIEWDVNNIGDDAIISDYITITPLNDGSNVATVTCYQGFEGSSFMIWVITRLGSFKASCIVTYIGVATSFEIIQNGGTISYDDGWGKEINHLDVGQTYYFDLAFDNNFNNVTDKYEPNFSFSSNSCGQIRINNKRYTNTTDNPTWVLQSDTIDTIDLSVINTGDSSYWAYTNTYLISATYDSTLKKIKISAHATYSSLNGSASQRGSKLVYSYAGLVDNKKPYFEVIITDNNIGYSQTLLLRTQSVVESVTLHNSELVF